MMNEKKIEINTLITKHENKCKGCRFDMIDVEDPLWEYGSPLKRVLIDNQTGETYDEVGKLVGLLNELETKCHKLERELEESSAFIIEQRKELKTLKEENEQLKKEYKIAIDIIEYLTDWFNKTEYLSVYKINEINNEIGLDNDE